MCAGNPDQHLKRCDADLIQSAICPPLGYLCRHDHRALQAAESDNRDQHLPALTAEMGYPAWQRPVLPHPSGDVRTSYWPRFRADAAPDKPVNQSGHPPAHKYDSSAPALISPGHREFLPCHAGAETHSPVCVENVLRHRVPIWSRWYSHCELQTGGKIAPGYRVIV